jgi:hypothetical protein
MISDNVLVFNIELPSELQGNNLNNHLEQFSDKALGVVAGFNKNFLEHFLIISKGKTQKDVEESLKKMETISYMIGPTGNLSYLGNDQIEYILTKVDTLKINEINENNIAKIGDEQLEKQFGAAPQYGAQQAVESQLSSAAFYLTELGYSEAEIKQKLTEVRSDPKKLDTLFNLPRKEILSGVPAGVSQGRPQGSSGAPRDLEQTLTITRRPGEDELFESYIKQIQQEQPPERAKKVAETMEKIKEHIKEHTNSQYERVFQNMHPDRLNRAFKFLKDTKRKSKRLPLLLEWFFCSHLIENIEFKVEHWQQSSAAGHGAVGVYTAGINFSRYDQIVNEFPDAKLAKVINISRRILQTPSKKAIQKLGQDLVAETGFDEHLFFTD